MLVGGRKVIDDAGPVTERVEACEKRNAVLTGAMSVQSKAATTRREFRPAGQFSKCLLPLRHVRLRAPRLRAIYLLKGGPLGWSIPTRPVQQRHFGLWTPRRRAIHHWEGYPADGRNDHEVEASLFCADKDSEVLARMGDLEEHESNDDERIPLPSVDSEVCHDGEACNVVDDAISVERVVFVFAGSGGVGDDGSGCRSAHGDDIRKCGAEKILLGQSHVDDPSDDLHRVRRFECSRRFTQLYRGTMRHILPSCLTHERNKKRKMVKAIRRGSRLEVGVPCDG